MKAAPALLRRRWGNAAHKTTRCRPAKTLSRPADEVAGPRVVPPLRLANMRPGDDAAQLRAALSGPSQGDPWGMCGEMTGDRRSPPCGQRKDRWKATVLPLCRFRSGREEAAIRFQGAASWPRCPRADREKTIRTHLDPPAFGRLRTGREAPHTPKARRVFCRWPPRCLKKAPCGSQKSFAQDVSPNVQRRAPCPVPCVCVSLSRLYLDCGKEFVWCPACGVVRVLRDMQAFGPSFVRRAVASARAGRA